MANFGRIKFIFAVASNVEDMEKCGREAIKELDYAFVNLT